MRDIYIYIFTSMKYMYLYTSMIYIYTSMIYTNIYVCVGLVLEGQIPIAFQESGDRRRRLRSARAAPRASVAHQMGSWAFCWPWELRGSKKFPWDLPSGFIKHG